MVFECKKLGVHSVKFHYDHFQVKGFLVYFSDISENTRPKVTLMAGFVGF